MKAFVKRAVLASLGVALGGVTAAAQPADPAVAPRASFSGTVDFFATGGTFTFNDDEDDRPDGLLEEGTVTVSEVQIPARATLVRAYLYLATSIFDDGDGIDAIDTEVELRVPGGSDYATVRADAVFEAEAVEGFPELSLQAARADITALISDRPMNGAYAVRGFDADIFDADTEHTAANASFALVLVFEEPRLPPRSIALFDGLERVLGSTVAVSLDGLQVSPVPSGALTFYAIEGDCHPGPDRCADGNNLSGPERVVVRAPEGRSLVLSDAANPANDIFNRTINTVDPPLVEVVGTDIDAFDISQVLRPGDTAIEVEVTAPRPSNGERGELVGLVFVILGVDVFAPELQVDSRVELRNELGGDLLFPGDPLALDWVVSNTGNLPASEVRVEFELPELVEAFEVRTGTLAVDGQRLVAEGLEVRDGEARAVGLRLRTRCPLPDGGALALTATVSAAGLPPVVLTTTAALEARERCGERFELFGGGGCRSASPSALALLVLFVLPFLAAHRRLWALALAVGGGAAACGGDGLEDRPAPAAIGIPCPNAPGMVVVPSVRGEPPFCIDQYEASVGVGSLGAPIQPEGGDGSTTVAALSERFAQPARGLTWHQAVAACKNAGKSLCSATRWRAACGGAADLTFPYGESYDPEKCNGFDAGRRGLVPTGGVITSSVTQGENRALGCVSPFGVYDLSGNAWEWNASVTLGGVRRGLAGGSYRSNEEGLSCLTDDADAPADEVDEAYGFRCCADLAPAN